MLNGKPVVILDCDDVVARCIHKMVGEVNKRTGQKYTEEDIKTWEVFGTLCDASYLKLRDEVKEMMKQSGWCLEIEPFPGAVSGVKKLQQISEVFFCTSPFNSPHWEYGRRVWLGHHFEIVSDHILQGSAKFLVRGEFFVDDKPENVKAWEEYLPTGTGLLWDRPHNQIDLRSRDGRVSSWHDLYNRVQKSFPSA